jgi:hypothetical protein
LNFGDGVADETGGALRAVFLAADFLEYKAFEEACFLVANDRRLQIVAGV